MTTFARGLTIALILAGCDQGAPAELADLREGLAAQATLITALQGRLERLEAALAAERSERARAQVARPEPAPPPVSLTFPPTAAEASGLPITCAANRCTIPREAYAKLLADPGLLARAARVVPNMQDGVVRGFKLYGIRANSPYALLGLQNGDLVTELAGKSLVSIEAVIEVYVELPTRNEWTIKGERRGAPLLIAVEIHG